MLYGWIDVKFCKEAKGFGGCCTGGCKIFSFWRVVDFK